MLTLNELVGDLRPPRASRDIRKLESRRSCFQALRMGSTNSHVYSTLSPWAYSVASPRMQSSSKAFVGLGNVVVRQVGIVKVHPYIFHLEPVTRDLHPETQQQPFVGLDPNDQLVVLRMQDLSLVFETDVCGGLLKVMQTSVTLVGKRLPVRA